MRYDDAFVMQCLLLKLKSNRAYRYILEEGMLPLPSVSTIRRVLSSSDCVFGFNPLALESIKKALHGLPVAERWGSLMWDEIKIKKDLTWNSKNLEWHGVVDFGGELKSKIQDGIADHALVFMFRPYKHSWIQPIACFATKSAASGKVLFELIVKAISILYNNNAVVKSCVSDGAQTNKSAMVLLGVKGTNSGDCKPHFNHPMEPSIKIYYFVDVPHLLKCVRNQVLNHKSVQVMKLNSFIKVNIHYIFSFFKYSLLVPLYILNFSLNFLSWRRKNL